MDIAIIKYNAGNIQSVIYWLERVGVEGEVTDDPEKIRKASRVIFPGVGEASSAMRYLKEHALDQLIVDLKQPVLGICLGMQLMCRFSEENDTVCLGIFDEIVKKFVPQDEKAKVPQIGWNAISHLTSPLFEKIPENSYCYFVHGYFASVGSHTIAQTNYTQLYSSGLQKDNFYGVQFHPEKSAGIGEQILRNFMKMKS